MLRLAALKASTLLLAAARGEPLAAARGVFGDDMVLQRGVPARLFGWGASPGATVVAALSGAGARATSAPADAEGAWALALPAQPATAAPQDVTLAASDGGAAVLRRVLFGDVHVCAGQSNAALSLSLVVNASAEVAAVAAGAYPHFRLLFAPPDGAAAPQRRLNATLNVSWALPAAANVAVGQFGPFSALCLFTARAIDRALGAALVPQGLVALAAAGTAIEAWAPPSCGYNSSSAGALFNGMVAPFAGVAVRDVIWLQGEANADAATPGGDYECKLRALVPAWRAALGAFGAFVVVQIAPSTTYDARGLAPAVAADVRQAQAAAAAAAPGCLLVTTADLVWPWSPPGQIHPANKQALGARVAAALLAAEYGVGARAAHPAYAAAARAAGAAVTVALAGCGPRGCALPGAPALPPGVNASLSVTWALQLEGGAWVRATAALGADGASVLLAPAEPPPPGARAVATAYGRAAYPVAALFGGSGLPAVGWCARVDSGAACYAE